MVVRRKRTLQLMEAVLALSGCFTSTKIASLLGVKWHAAHYVLNELVKENKIKMYKGQRGRIYCIGRSAQGSDVVACVKRLGPSFYLQQLAECVYGETRGGTHKILYKDLLWSLTSLLDGEYKYLIVVKGSKIRVVLK